MTVYFLQAKLCSIRGSDISNAPVLTFGVILVADFYISTVFLDSDFRSSEFVAMLIFEVFFLVFRDVDGYSSMARFLMRKADKHPALSRLGKLLLTAVDISLGSGEEVVSNAASRLAQSVQGEMSKSIEAERFSCIIAELCTVSGD